MRIERPGTSFGAWLLVAALVASCVAAGVGPVLAGQASSRGDAAPLDVQVQPNGMVLDGGTPDSFTITVSNPEAAGPRPVFLTVGVSPTESAPDRRTGHVSSVYLDGAPLLLVERMTLYPGQQKYLAVPVPPDVTPGEYEVNATVGYSSGGAHRTASDAATLTVESCRSLSGWLGCNSSWLLGVLGIFVAALSFFGYDRVRGRLRTVDAIDDTTDDRS